MMEPGLLIEPKFHCPHECGMVFEDGNSQQDMFRHAKYCDNNPQWIEQNKETCSAALIITEMPVNGKGKFKRSPGKKSKRRLPVEEKPYIESNDIDSK